jgi:serine protease Do
MKGSNSSSKNEVLFFTLTLLIVGTLWLLSHFQLNTTEEEERTSALLTKNNEEAYEEKRQSELIELKALIRNSQPKVVTIEVDKKDGTAIGSGFLYNLKGDIVTNAHVVADAEKIVVKLNDESEYEGTVIGMGKIVDIAIIRVVELEGREPLKISRQFKREIGTEVIALGSPLGLENTVTTGIISGLGRDFSINEYKYLAVYQISAPISPGSSGGPLLDRQTGDVIGINSARVNQETIGFSIPIIHVLPILENWSKYPYGIPVAPPNGDIPKYNN